MISVNFSIGNPGSIQLPGLVEYCRTAFGKGILPMLKESRK